MLGAAVVAAALVFLATSAPGPGLDPDSMAYVGAANSLAHEGRLRVPTAEWNRRDSTSTLSLWPPGFPAVVALPVVLGASPIQSARWINILSAALAAATIVMIIAAPLGLWAGVAAVLMVFATQAVFDSYLSVLSEPLFLAIMLLLLATMIHARDRLLLLSVLATAAVMVRYAGACAPAAAVLWTIFDSRRDTQARWRRAITVALLPSLFIASWFSRTALARDRHATPKLHLYGGWGATLLGARDTLAEWLAPLLADGSAQRIIALLLAVLLGAFILATATDTAGNRLRQLRVSGVATILRATTLLGASYLAVVLASRAFVGGTIPLDWRILVPLIVLFELQAVTAISYWWRAYHLPVHAALVALGAVWLVAAGTVTANDAMYAATVGSDFAADSWRQSPLIAWVRAHGNGRPLYSNWPPALYFHAHRIARELPDTARPHDLSSFAAQLRSNHGYVVGFDERSPDFISPPELAQKVGLREVVRTSDGTVWAADSVATSLSAVPAASDSAATGPAGSRRQR